MTDTLQIVRGSEFRTFFAWLDDAGAPRDATGITVTALMRHPWTQVPYAPSVAVGWTDPATGVGEIFMDETQTALIERGALSEIVVQVVSAGVVTDIFVGGIVEGV